MENRARILSAAARVFGTRGVEAGMDDVAREAGCGIGTLYRRFRSKEALVDALFDDRLDQVAAVWRVALEDEDPMAGLVAALHEIGGMFALDRGLHEVLLGSRWGADLGLAARQALRPMVTELVGRAQDAGQLRGDLDGSDIPIIVYMVAAAIDYTDGASPDAWRRYLSLLVDGLSADHASGPLPGTPPCTIELEAVATARRPSHHLREM